MASLDMGSSTEEPHEISCEPDPNDYHFIPVGPPSFDLLYPAEHLAGVPLRPDDLQYHYAATNAAPIVQFFSVPYALTHTFPTTFSVHPVNDVFVPSSTDLARGRINQAVHNARWHHDYVDNTAKACKVRAAFDKYFGNNVANLTAWQDICFFCGKDPIDMSTNIRACKIFLRSIHVNIFDLITAVDDFMSTKNEDPALPYKVTFPLFTNARKLEQYSREKGLICPAHIGKGNDLFRFMLTKWF